MNREKTKDRRVERCATARHYTRRPTHLQYRRVRLALDKLAGALRAEPALAVDDQFSAQEHLGGIALDLPALVKVVVGPHVHGARADGVLLVRIPQHNVGIASDGQRALTRIHAEYLGWVGSGQLDEAVRAEVLPVDALIPHHHLAILNPRHAVGNLAKIAFPQLLTRNCAWSCAVEETGAMIGRDGLQQPRR